MIRKVVKEGGEAHHAAWIGGKEVRKGREMLVESGIPAYETPEDAVRTYFTCTVQEEPRAPL